MTKKILNWSRSALAIAVIALGCSTNTNAGPIDKTIEKDKPSEIVFIDREKLYGETAALKNAQQKLEKKAAALRKIMEAVAKKAQELDMSITSLKGTGSPELVKKEAELKKMQDMMTMMSKVLYEKLVAVTNKIRDVIEANLERVTQSISQSKGYRLILVKTKSENNPILFTNYPDITQLTADTLNKEMPEFPQDVMKSIDDMDKETPNPTVNAPST